MTVKLLLLKSGENVIADVKEMVVGDEEDPKVVGYFLNKPCIVNIKIPKGNAPSDVEKNNIQTTSFKISLFPWMPLSKDSNIPISTDWVITMVNPDDKLNTMYIENVVNYGKDNQNIIIDEQSDSDNSD
jgi:hypothetical protein